MKRTVDKSPVVAQQDLAEDDFLDVIMDNAHAVDLTCAGASILARLFD